MARNLISTRELLGVRVLGKAGSRRIGKVSSFVFHPRAKRCIGYIVKRPDVALMFHRKDLFVAIDGCDIVDGRIVVSDDAAATGKAACERLGVSWDDCVLWLGLPVMCQDGTAFGSVGSVTFDLTTGAVVELEVDAGLTANALLGKRRVSAEYVLGFRRGIGTRLLFSREDRSFEDDGDEAPPDPSHFGAIIVADEVKEKAVEGGIAEKAGQATAVVRVKAKDVADKAKPTVDKATQAAGKAVNKGAFAIGKQIGRSKGMFAAFKEEYDKARHDDASEKR